MSIPKNVAFRILADATLPGLEQAFPKPLQLSLYQTEQELHALLPEQDILLCRSTLKINAALLKQQRLKYIATASSGTDHLDYACLAQKKITVFDAKGCNAVSVADYVLACLAFLNQQHLIQGQRAVVIGYGHVGNEVYKRLQQVGYTVQAYDPLKAMAPNTVPSNTLNALYEADLICIHAELHDNHPYPSRHLIDAQLLSQLKPECVIINASRGDIVAEHALINATRPFIYCTDVYLNEPLINPQIIEYATLCTPHIAGHSLEAKYNAVNIISQKIHKALNITPPTDYAKPLPATAMPKKNYSSWQEMILDIYNPALETHALKQATNLTEAFLNLRQNHQHRHDFYTYEC